MKEDKKVEYYEDGTVKYEEYILGGQLSREDNKPAWISYYQNGKVKYEQYYLDGKWHRDNGRPAWISYDEKGKVCSAHYYLDGKYYSKEEYNKIIQEVKSLDIANKLLDPRKWVRELGKREIKVG